MDVAPSRWDGPINNEFIFPFNSSYADDENTFKRKITNIVRATSWRYTSPLSLYGIIYNVLMLCSCNPRHGSLLWNKREGNVFRVYLCFLSCRPIDPAYRSYLYDWPFLCHSPAQTALLIVVNEVGITTTSQTFFRYFEFLKTMYYFEPVY